MHITRKDHRSRATMLGACDSSACSMHDVSVHRGIPPGLLRHQDTNWAGKCKSLICLDNLSYIAAATAAAAAAAVVNDLPFLKSPPSFQL
jgi:hypothetical protein